MKMETAIRQYIKEGVKSIYINWVAFGSNAPLMGLKERANKITQMLLDAGYLPNHPLTDEQGKQIRWPQEDWTKGASPC